VRGVDASPGFVEYAKTHVRDARVLFEVADAQALPLTGTVDAAVSGLALNFVPEPQRAITELARVTAPGGVVAAYVWDYAGKMDLMSHFWSAAVALDPAAESLDEGRRFPFCQPEPLQDMFMKGGLRDLEVRAIDIPTVFRDFDDYWSPFLGGQGPAPAYAVSLSDERQALLREHLRSRLPIDKDGSIHLLARAWAIRGLAGKQ